MTTAEKLQAITKDIREKLPRLMQLEEGCFIKDKGTDAIGKIVCIKGEAYIIEWLDSTYRYLKYDQCSDDYVKNRFRSLGKEPMLTDVLEWLGTELYTIVTQGLEVYGKDDLYMFTWDLSQPYLKDQSEEVIDFLYEFLKEKI